VVFVTWIRSQILDIVVQFYGHVMKTILNLDEQHGKGKKKEKENEKIVCKADWDNPEMIRISVILLLRRSMQGIDL
jgi:hypothetical protein